MRIIKDLSIEGVGTNTHNFNLNEFDDGVDDIVLAYGFNIINGKSNQNEIEKYNRKIYLNVTMPTEFCGGYDIYSDDIFDEIYSICPFSNKWLNNLKKTDKYKTICYPYNLTDIPVISDKTYDVCYHGFLHGKEHYDCIDVISKFNYRFMYLDLNNANDFILKHVTNYGLTHTEKIKLVSSCKISICYNRFPLFDKHVNNITEYKDWTKNEAFKSLTSNKMMPQFKSRFVEAAISKTLNLVRKDEWNVVEHFYVPDEDFIYFESNDDLENKISGILSNWSAYEVIINNAYNKTLNYSTSALIKNIKNNGNIEL